MIIGTSHFESASAAHRYYRGYGYTDATQLIEEGVVAIGAPVLNDGEVCYLDRDRRYFIECKTTQASSVAHIESKVRTLKDELALCCAVGNEVLLPEKELTFYKEIRSKLLDAGATYCRGKFVFDISISAVEILSALSNGKRINVKQETQSFYTPEELGYQLFARMGEMLGKRVLEPSAGDGALADMARARGGKVTVVETNPVAVRKLQQKGYEVVEQDFLTLQAKDLGGKFDFIAANPPWTKNQDIDHVLHMWDMLAPGGELAALVSQSWVEGGHKKQASFRKFLEANEAEIELIPAGAFKTSGTMVGSVLISLRKPHEILFTKAVVSVPCSTLQHQPAFDF